MKTTAKNRAVLAEAIARSWKDDAFRQELKSNPRKLLEAGGMDIPAETEVIALENTPSVIYAVLPPLAEQAQYEKQLAEASTRIADLPDNVELRIVRDTPSKAHIILPLVPGALAAGVLSDEQLEQVAGGKSSVSTEQTAVTATTAATAAEAAVDAVEVQTVATTTTVAAEVEAVVVPCFIS